MRRVIVLGIDGLSLSVLARISSMLKLSNIEEVLNRSIIKRAVNSVIPPASAPAWTSIFTGLEPYQHGVYDFFDLRTLRKGIIKINRYLSSKELWQKTLWSRMSKQGKSVLVVGVPVFYPAREVNGVYVCGELLTPRFDYNAVYPRKYYMDVTSMGMNKTFNEMHDLVTKIMLISNLGSQSDKKMLVRELTAHERVKFKVFKDFFERKEYDLSVFISTAYDYLAHYMLNEHEFRETSYLLRDYFEFINEVFGYINSYTSSGKYVLTIISDHGIHTVDKIFLINTWLMNRGLLKTKRTIPKRYFTLKNFGIHVVRLLSVFPTMRNKIYKYIERKVRESMKLHSIIENIILDSSIAYALSYSSFGIFVKNNDIKKQVAQSLRKYLDGMFNVITSRDPQAPDIFLVPCKGYTLSTAVINSKKALVDRKVLGTKIADHTMDATFILYGSNDLALDTFKTKITSIMDLATIVYQITCS